jgi:hypothetical protein
MSQLLLTRDVASPEGLRIASVGPLEDSPLAVCDARSIAPDDLIASDLIYPDRIGEA